VIARKYPGNAEAAQDELMALAVEGAQLGKTVLRMKQGDPFLYGRGGEEVLHFRKHGFESVVIPGLSSCLAGPTIAGIPVTQRGVAESLVVCTGVGRGGRIVQVAGYERGKTLCVLMGVARLRSLVESLLDHPTSKYPPYLPIALIERASSPDQRVVASTIEQLADVLDNLPPHRPPGMIVVGWAVMCLDGEGDMTILDDPEDKGRETRDRARVEKWNGKLGYRVREGLGEDWRSVVEVIEQEDKKKRYSETN
jgi:uroporphyrin-III C-methyltransferase